MKSQNTPDANEDLKLTEDIQLASNTASDDRWKISWGFISARPHEYLIHIRNGELVRKTTGQANRCFKRPNDTVILIPTSLKQLTFHASQLTLDNIFIRLRGFVIYRISQPEKIYERISFWDRQSGEKKLALMIGEQCRSHSKWMVANMNLEDCLRKRKEAIADSLLQELGLVITEERFGVSLESIDIQDIKIFEEPLFMAYQSPAKEIIFKNQQLSALERKRDVRTRELQQEQEMSEREKETKLHVLANEVQINEREREKLEIELRAKRQTERDQSEHTRALIDFEEEQKRLQRQRDAALKREIELADQQIAKQKADLELEVVRARYQIDDSLSPVAMEKIFLEKSLPQIANAVTASLKEARITIYQGADGGGGLPLSLVVNEIMTMLQSRLTRLKEADSQ
jgi:regulator of protease activity HflC (stomatin/prohibitin superfamily)